MFRFITEKPFWVNLVAAASLGLLIVFLVLQLLGWITNHGAYLTVPSVVGKNTNDAVKLLESKGFDVMIQDSVYTDTLMKGTVIKQLPDPNATVKVNRTVYITVNRYIPPMIPMPSLEGKSLNFALEILQRSHLQLGDTVYKPDFMKGSVLEQQYNGQRILPGTKLQWGSRVNLVIAGGLEDKEMIVPDLTGMTLAEAKTELEVDGINIGAVIATGAITDSATAFVYKQSPARFDEAQKPIYIRSGQLMDIWISQVMIYLKDSVENKHPNQEIKNK